LIVWVIAGLLALATGLRIGWGLVNHQSVVSSAMIVALASLAALAALNWPPLTLLVDTALRWPNISIGLSQIALVFSAAGSCVMITTAASGRSPAVTRRLAMFQYCLAALIAASTLVLFLAGERQPEMAPREYLVRNLGTPNTALDWLVPLLYVLMALTLVAWVGARLSNPSRRGRALFVFTAGIVLIAVASAFALVRVVLSAGATPQLAGATPQLAGAAPQLAGAAPQLAGVGTAVTLLVCAMAVVATGALLPAVEDWVGARRELHLIEPLRQEMKRRHPDIGIGVRPRGPLVFRVAEQLSLISDALYLEAVQAERESGPAGRGKDPAVEVSPAVRALVVARWIGAGPGWVCDAYPGRSWLRQPPGCSDREWILEIAYQYRTSKRGGKPPATGTAVPSGPIRMTD